MAKLCGLFKSVKFVYRASRVFAVLPYTMYSSSGVTGVTPSHFSYLFSVFTTLVISAHGVTYPFVVVGMEVPCFFCWTIPGMVGTNSSTTIALTGYRLQAIAMKVINRLLISMMSFSALLFALFYASKMPEFVEKIQNSDYYFRVLLSHSKQSVKCCISGKIILGLTIITLEPTFYYMYSEISRPDLSVVSIILLIVLMWDNINAAVCEAQFGNYAYLLKVRFRILNNYLINLQQLTRGKCLEEYKK
ncbi:hypothetical protein J6590_073346 [Homalodisca vitripennis]|nr:hypothetical protein J6590_073346 [Homalodisca vitripennis]